MLYEEKKNYIKRGFSPCKASPYKEKRVGVRPFGRFKARPLAI